MATEETKTIAGAAELVVHGFQLCLQLSAQLHPRELASVEDQFARFSIWHSGIGVFARGRASMDHRLREATDVRDAVISLLEDLADSVQDCSLSLQTMLDSRKEATASEEMDVASYLRAAVGEIQLLYRISNTIRRASEESQNDRATTSYRIRDDDGNDAEPMLQELFTNYIRDRFPSITDSLRLRLAFSMVLRRRRILYRRSRYGESPIRTEKTISQPQIRMPQSQSQEPVAFDSAKDAKSAPAKSITRSLAPSATTLAIEQYRRASTPSVISAVKTVTMGNNEGLIFPPAPNGRIKARYKLLEKQRRESHREFLASLLDPLQLENNGHVNAAQYLSGQYKDYALDSNPEHHAKISVAERKLQDGLESDWNDCHEAVPEVICPFCLYALPSLSICDDRSWNAHVTKDLDAYVCLFDNCDQPDELYRHSSGWLQHMRLHALRWYCNSKSHGELTFLTEKLYLSHMRGVHTGSFTEPQLRALAERNPRPDGPLFTLCPMCGTTEAADTMEAHIIGHLRLLALKSLPPFQDAGAEAESCEESGSVPSSPSSRSTIKRDNDRYVIPVFEDAGDHRTWHFDTAGSSDAYAPWGGYRGYIAAIPDGGNHCYGENAPSGARFAPPDSIDAQNELSTPAGRFSNDPSSRFIDSSLFDGIGTEDRMKYEWGFVINTGEEKLELDHVIQSMVEYNRIMKQCKIEDCDRKHVYDTIGEARIYSAYCQDHTCQAPRNEDTPFCINPRDSSNRYCSFHGKCRGNRDCTAQASRSEKGPFPYICLHHRCAKKHCTRPRLGHLDVCEEHIVFEFASKDPAQAEQLAMAQHLLSLTCPDESAHKLDSRLYVTFGTAKDGQSDRVITHINSSSKTSNSVSQSNNGLVTEGERAYISLENDDSQEIYVSVFNINAAGKISKISDLGGELSPGKSYVIGGRGGLRGLPFMWPAGIPRRQPLKEFLVLVLTDSPVDLSCLADVTTANLQEDVSLFSIVTGAKSNTGNENQEKLIRYDMLYMSYRMRPAIVKDLSSTLSSYKEGDKPGKLMNKE